jgi:hypothetical protein
MPVAITIPKYAGERVFTATASLVRILACSVDDCAQTGSARTFFEGGLA